MPAVTKQIVCLANSRKISGRCIAGVELVEGKPAGWLRPVSDREHQEVSEYERQYEDGSDPRLLDIIDILLVEARPKDYQQENWLLNPEFYWQKVGVFRWDELHRIAKLTEPLWRNGYHTFNGRNDQIPLPEACMENHSLKLVYVDDMVLRVFAPGIAFGNAKRRVQAQFRFLDTAYALWVTDPRIERAYLAKADGEYRFGECYLTVSLGEPFNDNCHKLVATVLEKPR